MITKEEAAARLDGNEYGNEGSRELWAEMKAAGLVAVFGASDDLMEFRGAVDDEVGAFNGGNAFLDRNGLIGDDDDDDRKGNAAVVTAKWCPSGARGPSWEINTALPSVPFTIKHKCGCEWCIGLVFSLADCPEV